MATRTNYFIQASLDHFYLNEPVAGIGDATGLPASATDGNLYVALLVDNTEANYGGYARQPIPRTAAGFVRAANVISNVAMITFPRASSGSNVINNVAIYDSLAAGNQLHLQTIADPITVTTNVQPIIEAAALEITGS